MDYEYIIYQLEMYDQESEGGYLDNANDPLYVHVHVHVIILTVKVGTFPKNRENLSASIVAEVTISLRSLRRETTCNNYHTVTNHTVTNH